MTWGIIIATNVWINNKRREEIRRKREREGIWKMSTSRAVPFVRIVHQPSSVYRMRYKKENRSTFLYAENAPQSSQIQNQPTSSSPSTTTTTTTTSSSSTSINSSAPATTKKAVRKKGGGVSNDAPDGTFPKIEVLSLSIYLSLSVAF